MATLRQIVSNRKNSAQSTGPVTEEGKEIARRNAVRHGMTSKILLPEEHTEKLESRIEGFRASVEIRNELQEFQIREAAAASLRVEICRVEAIDRRVELSQIADSDTNEWDDDRWEEALAIAATLSRNPARVLARLRKLPAGRKWLISQWEQLLAYFDPMSRLSLGCEQYNLMLDLMGCPPRDQLNQKGLLKKAYEAGPEKFIEAKIAELKELAKHDDLRNEFLRGQHRRGLEVGDDSKFRRIVRYESASRRIYRQSIAAIETANAEAARSVRLAQTSKAAETRKENRNANPNPTPPKADRDKRNEARSHEVRPNVRMTESMASQADHQVDSVASAQVSGSAQSSVSAQSSQKVFRGNRRQRKAQAAQARQLEKGVKR